MDDQPRTNRPTDASEADAADAHLYGPESPCPYLPDRLARYEAYDACSLDGVTYEHLMARWFRRSGNLVYRPRCRGCRACQPIRIPVRRFARSRSMRRVWTRNADIRVEVSAPIATADKFKLFVRYLDRQHDKTMTRTFDAFERFLYDSPLESFEFGYFLGQRLIGVSIVDGCPGGLSSVYMYFDPSFARRSPGTLSILHEIEYCRREGLSYYYLGYYVAGSPTMVYKARFQPHEILVREDDWKVLSE